jgi:hypothetical protein
MELRVVLYSLDPRGAFTAKRFNGPAVVCQRTVQAQPVALSIKLVAGIQTAHTIPIVIRIWRC